MIYTPRYSVCMPGEPPTEILATNYRPAAFEKAAETPGSVVYDWTTGLVIDENAVQA